MAPEPSAQHEPAPLRRQHLRSTLFAALLAAIVILTLLGHNRLTDWDEGIYAQVSREMLQSGWLVPHWNFQTWLEKPPLTFWITSLFFKLFGISEFTARLGSALSAIAIVAVLHAWLARTRDSLTAWLSTVILLSTFGFLHVARVGETDTLLSLGSLLALIGLADLLHQPTFRATSGWYLFWTGFAIALMSKGAASGALLISLFLLFVLDPNLRRRLRAPFFLGLLLFLALTLPWHLYLLHRFGQTFVSQYLDLHVLGRITHQYEGHLTPWWYYLRVILFSAPPWVLLYPAALYATFRVPNLHYLRPFAVFAVVQVVAFSCVQTRLPHYIAPAYAPFAALVAIWIANRVHALNLAHRTSIFRLSLAAATAVLWILTALATAHARSQLHSPTLPNGNITPNNREEIAILKQVFRNPSPLVASTPGPLLDWRPGTFNPIPSVIFYANRPVQQVILQPLPPNTPTDIYAYNPIPLAQSLADFQPRLILIARSLVPQIPANYAFQPIAASPTLEIGRISKQIRPTN
jgi:4-amino-4-deoxy-L-arabinose transferase-like glycosyltransferase